MGPVRTQPWEYKTELIQGSNATPALLNALRVALDSFGQQGWELVHLNQKSPENYWVAVFKRPANTSNQFQTSGPQLPATAATRTGM